jgi:hypothetical protein
MAMSDYIRNHALANVWCTPDQDRQVIFKPARISRGSGIKNDIRIMWELYKLPTVNQKYHVYQIGQIHPVIVGLIEDVYKWSSTPSNPSGDYYSTDNIWIPFNQIMSEQKMVANFYINSGKEMPRTTSYAMVTDDKNLIIAVLDEPAIIPNLYLEDFYIRLYSNAFFNSVRSNSYPHEISVFYRKIIVPQDIVDMQTLSENKKLERGSVFIYVNGIFKDSINGGTVQLGDTVEFYHDSSVKSVIDIPLVDSETFDSTLDLKRKYLLLYPETVDNDLIDYQDDIDFYLIRKPNASLPNSFVGCYYHKNKTDAVRMITHKDYSICVPYVSSYISDHSFFGNSSDNVIARLYIREAGYDRPLVNENNRIKELYKLTNAQVKGAMVGINATLSNWRAETLEASAYTEIMRVKSIDVTKQLVEDAYGYNAVSKLIADSPINVIETPVRYCVMPVGLSVDSTVCEFDEDGYLLNHSHHVNDLNYFPYDVNCKMIDSVIGIPSNRLDMVFGVSSSVLNPVYTYRMYKTRIISGIIQWNDWEEAVSGADYNVVGNNLSWVVDNNIWYTCLKSDSKVLCYDFTQDQSDYLINFTIANEETHSSITTIKALDIAPGNIDIWLNGKYLIEGLDYIMRWPDIVICNKEYLIDNQLQNFTVRATGFCTSDMKPEVPDEFGFIINGVMSRNSIFDIRDDKVIMIAIEGSMRTRDDLTFTENLPIINVPTARNGAPYVIKDVIVPLRDSTITNGNVLRNNSLLIDKAVSDYLTQYIGEVPDPLPNIIPHRYNLFSPFCARIIRDLKDGILILPGITGNYSDMDITAWLSSYEWILPFDPCRNTIDENYVTIHPHPLYTTINLNIYQYTFMERVINLYLSNKVDLTRFVTMTIN